MRISDWSSDVCSSDLKNRDLALEVQALEVVHAQRRCMHGLADEYRRRLDLRLRGIETRLGQELVLEPQRDAAPVRSEEHTSELQSLMRSSYAVFCLKKKTTHTQQRPSNLCTRNSTSTTV